jgi:hypothetical protein
VAATPASQAGPNSSQAQQGASAVAQEQGPSANEQFVAAVQSYLGVAHALDTQLRAVTGPLAAATCQGIASKIEADATATQTKLATLNTDITTVITQGKYCAVAGAGVALADVVYGMTTQVSGNNQYESALAGSSLQGIQSVVGLGMTGMSLVTELNNWKTKASPTYQDAKSTGISSCIATGMSILQAGMHELSRENYAKLIKQNDQTMSNLTSQSSDNPAVASIGTVASVTSGAGSTPGVNQSALINQANKDLKKAETGTLVAEVAYAGIAGLCGVNCFDFVTKLTADRDAVVIGVNSMRADTAGMETCKGAIQSEIAAGSTPPVAAGMAAAAAKDGPLLAPMITASGDLNAQYGVFAHASTQAGYEIGVASAAKTQNASILRQMKSQRTGAPVVIAQASSQASSQAGRMRRFIAQLDLAEKFGRWIVEPFESSAVASVPSGLDSCPGAATGTDSFVSCLQAAEPKLANALTRMPGGANGFLSTFESATGVSRSQLISLNNPPTGDQLAQWITRNSPDKRSALADYYTKTKSAALANGLGSSLPTQLANLTPQNQSQGLFSKTQNTVLSFFGSTSTPEATLPAAPVAPLSQNIAGVGRAPAQVVAAELNSSISLFTRVEAKYRDYSGRMTADIKSQVLKDWGNN